MSRYFRTNFNMPSELHARLTAVAEGRSLAAMVREAIIQWLREEEARARKT